MGAAVNELTKIAKLADLAETVLEAVREGGFLVTPRPRKRVRTTAASTTETAPDGTETPRRRGRPKGSKSKTTANNATEQTAPGLTPPPPPADASVADDLTEEEFE